jgi:hypothetical protein
MADGWGCNAAMVMRLIPLLHGSFFTPPARRAPRRSSTDIGALVQID